MQLSEYLKAIAAPELIICEPRSTIKTTNPAHPREYLSDLTEWVGIKKDIKELFEPKLSFEVDLQSSEFEHIGFTQKRTNRAASCSDENDVVSLGEKAYESPALTILEECFGIVGHFCHHRAGCNLGDPDRVFVVKDTPTERGRGKLVVEWKTPWALTTPNNLVEEFNDERLSDEPPTRLVKAVSQLYGYMTYNNLEFGVLCNYESLYLFRRVGDSGLEVSPPFKFSDTGTESPVAALTYICHRVVTVGSFHYSPIERGPSGTHILKIEDLVVRGTWKEKDDPEIPWERMNLYLTERVTRNTATVMLGEIRSQLGPRRLESQKAVFKVYEINTNIKKKAADQEIEAYQKLKSLQGSYIPKLYAAGTYMKSLRVLILEHCGKAASPDCVDVDFWAQARKAVQALHKAGAVHGDIKLDNFTISTLGARLIDLGLCRQGTDRERAEELRDSDLLKDEWYKHHAVEEEDEAA
ncbi:hypothetical protein TWF718_003331 [Orbilia javanica]|uniref:Protein kinase domain-containing protein n=1 Tax=Orbilia javanica TaxID=47235 RepID=A0AAN8NKJ3_9PEZI